jgi:hypothetical protein
VVVDYLDVGCISIRPFETDPPLIVDPDAVLALPIALQPLKLVSRRYPQVLYVLSCFEQEELPQSLTLNVFAPLGDADPIEYLRGL